MTAWFTSDTHFLHRRMSEIRGFSSQHEHDEAIIAKWNAVVKPGDLVWHLGDVGMGSTTLVLEKVKRLNGVKHLVTGNHDPCWPGHREGRKHLRRWLEAFETVQPFARTAVNGMPVLLSHFPYHIDHTDDARHTQFRLRDEGGWLVHGHTHLPAIHDEPRSLHAGLDAWGLQPASEVELASLIATVTAVEDAGKLMAAAIA